MLFGGEPRAPYRVRHRRIHEHEERELADRAALITGASSGIGLAIARTLGEEGYALTVSARRPEKLEAAAEELRASGLEVQSVVANMTDEEDVVGVFAKHREAYGRLDVLVNNAGVGIGAAMDEIKTKYLDMQLAVNLRALIIGTREGLPMLREAGAEHGKALIVNTASIAGKGCQAWLSIYAATKAAVINFTQSTHREVGNDGKPVRFEFFGDGDHGTYRPIGMPTRRSKRSKARSQMRRGSRARLTPGRGAGRSTPIATEIAASSVNRRWTAWLLPRR